MFNTNSYAYVRVYHNLIVIDIIQKTSIVLYLHILIYTTGQTPTFEKDGFIKWPPFMSRRWYFLFTEDITKFRQI